MDALLDRLQAELGGDANRAVITTCILTRLHEKFPGRAPTRAEVYAEADAWLAEVRALAEADAWLAEVRALMHDPSGS